MPYRIGAYLIDPETYEIREDGRPVPVEPQVFDLLIMLIENRQRTVSKDEIIEQVWKGRIISDATLSSRIKSARQALGDDGSAQKLIRTIHGRGFRFVGDVEQLDPLVAAETDAGAAATDAGGIAAKPISSRKWALVTAACLALVGAGVLVDQLLIRPARTGSDDVIERTALTGAGSGAQEAATFKDCDVCPEMVELPTGYVHDGLAGRRARSRAGRRIAAAYRRRPALCARTAGSHRRAVRRVRRGNRGERRERVPQVRRQDRALCPDRGIVSPAGLRRHGITSGRLRQLA